MEGCNKSRDGDTETKENGMRLIITLRGKQEQRYLMVPFSIVLKMILVP